MCKQIDHDYTDEIVCPYCGYEFGDSWECGGNEEDIGLLDCRDCNKEFDATRNIRVSYSTQKTDDWKSCEECGNRRSHFPTKHGDKLLCYGCDARRKFKELDSI